jgi:transcription initiation factor TFIIIB Brf1 subunit/transcription initiation factor TFIIB
MGIEKAAFKTHLNQTKKHGRWVCDDCGIVVVE